MSQHVVRDLIVEIARYANYDGPSLSIGPSDNSLARMNVRNGSHGLHLDPQIFEISGFSGFRPHRQQRDGLKSVLRVGGPIFGKATNLKVAITICYAENTRIVMVIVTRLVRTPNFDFSSP